MELKPEAEIETQSDVTEQIYKLNFTDRDWVVRVREPSTGALLAAAKLSSADFTAIASGRFTLDDALLVDRALTEFGKCLISWNLKRNGEPIPATVEGIMSLSFHVSLYMMESWLIHLDAYNHAQKLASKVNEEDLPMQIN